jgi:hypothetical protein
MGAAQADWQSRIFSCARRGTETSAISNLGLPLDPGGLAVREPTLQKATR